LSKETQKIVIVGGGFAGLSAAKSLGGDSRFEVLLLDRRNYHLFQPLLYQVATSGLNPSDIAHPIRTTLSKYKNVKVRLANVTRVDSQAKQVECDFGRVSYDTLILACGATHSYFGNESWEEFAPGLKTISQAIEIRRRLLLAFEKANNIDDLTEKRRLLTFAVVGAGPTGVELAGAVCELSRHTLINDFENISREDIRVILVEGSSRVLGTFHESLSAQALKDLKKMGAEVILNTHVTRVDASGVMLGEQAMPAATVVWAAGVEPAPINKTVTEKLDNKRLIVDQYCQVLDSDDIFAIGDQACFRTVQGNALPGLAPVALQQGRYVAKFLQKSASGQQPKPFRYMDKGAMATIGRNKAVLEAFGIRLYGLPAWVAWLAVHIIYLIGFRNRLLVILQWIWGYFTFSKGERLIINRDWRLSRDKRPYSEYEQGRKE